MRELVAEVPFDAGSTPDQISPEGFLARFVVIWIVLIGNHAGPGRILLVTEDHPIPQTVGL
jgi:hypothetical protein